jgi:hypothetical protein
MKETLGFSPITPQFSKALDVPISQLRGFLLAERFTN